MDVDRSGREWVVDDEFAARLGCGSITAAILPVWLLAMLLAFGQGLSDLGVWSLAALLVITTIGSIIAWFRIGAVPRRVTLRGDVLLVDRRRGSTTVSVHRIETLRVGASGPLRSVELDLSDGGRIRLTRQLTDFDQFVAAVHAANPRVRIESTER